MTAVPSSVTILRVLFLVGVFGMIGAVAYHQHRRPAESDRGPIAGAVAR